MFFVFVFPRSCNGDPGGCRTRLDGEVRHECVGRCTSLFQKILYISIKIILLFLLFGNAVFFKHVYYF